MTILIAKYDWHFSCSGFLRAVFFFKLFCSLGILCHASVMSESLRPHGLQPGRLLCPWDSPGKDTGVGCHFFLQGIFSTQGQNPSVLCLLLWQAASLPLAPPGKPQDSWSLSILIIWPALISAFQLNSLGLLILACYKLVFPGVLGSIFFFPSFSASSVSNPTHFPGLQHYFIYWQHICFQFHISLHF